MYEKEILAIYKFAGIKYFPVNLESIVNSIGYSLKTYQEVAKTKEQMMEMKIISGDAYADRGKKIIYYNDSSAIPVGRKRFSIAHEIGHITLLVDDEDVANEYASNLLAPRPIIFARQLKTSTQISRAFQISISAANNSLISQMYIPDESGFEIIDYFNERHSCPWPHNQVLPEEMPLFVAPPVQKPIIRNEVIPKKKKTRTSKKLRDRQAFIEFMMNNIPSYSKEHSIF